MAEAQAQEKYSCPACGAEAVWNPAKQALVCAYCSAVSPATLDVKPGSPDAIVEHDLVTALRGIPDSSRGWQAKKTSVRCQSCQAISVFDENRVGQRCDFCGSSSLVPYDQIKESFRPESLLPIKVTEVAVREKIREWYGTRWFAPGKLGTKAMTDQVKGIYIPYWTFDARVFAHWEAESGYFYYVTEEIRDAQGNRQTVQVQKIRWEHSAGDLEHFFDDEMVCASKGVDPDLIPKLQWPTKELVPYDAGFLAGWIVERYQLDLVAGAERSREIMASKLRSLCDSEVPGDTHRNLEIEPDWSGQTFKHILVPIWLLTYHFGGRKYQVLVDGYRGQITGKHPRSFWKIFFLVLAILMLLGLILYFTES